MNTYLRKACLFMMVSLVLVPASMTAQAAFEVEVLGGPVAGVPLDVDLRSLPATPGWKPGDELFAPPRRDDGSGNPVVDTPERADTLAQKQWDALGELGGPAVTDVLSFNGNSSTANPNDPTGEVGRDYFIEAINGPGGSSVTVYDKTDGSLEAGPFAMDTLGASGSCTSGLGDPIIIYDHLAERWLLTEFSAGGNRLCLYTSRTQDPITGGWCFYEFNDNQFPDYPKFALWPDMYHASSNQGNVAPVYAFDRANMLSQDGTTCPTARAPQKLTNAPGLPGLGFEAFSPVDLDGPAPPAGTPAYLVRQRDEELNGDPNPSATEDIVELWALDVDFDNSANSTFVQRPDLIVGEFDSNLCPPIGVFSCIPQPSGPNLDPLLEVIMNKATYRNFGSHETILAVLQTDIGGDQSAERWMEFRSAPGARDFSLFQEGTYAGDSPDNAGRFMGMASMDGAGNILLAYNVSGNSVFPSIRYTGRLASDPSGIMTVPETEVATGGASNSSSRYGDYNQMSVDPVDNCTFWFLGMYNPSGKAVRLSAVRFDSCTSTDLVLDISGSCPGPVTVTASNVTPSASTAFLWSATAGQTTIPSGACAGVAVDLDGAQLLQTVAADGGGTAVLNANAPAGACGVLLQAVDLSACGRSNVVTVD